MEQKISHIHTIRNRARKYITNSFH